LLRDNKFEAAKFQRAICVLADDLHTDTIDAPRVSGTMAIRPSARGMAWLFS